jgi:hypothetical protein
MTLKRPNLTVSVAQIESIWTITLTKLRGELVETLQRQKLSVKEKEQCGYVRFSKNTQGGHCVTFY